MYKRPATHPRVRCSRLRPGVAPRDGAAESERGAVLVVALILVTMFMTAGGFAISESLNGTFTASVARNQLQTSAAGRAGVGAVLGALESDLSSAGPWSCPAGTYVGGALQVNSVGGGAADASSVESVTVSFAEGATAAAAQSGLSSATACTSAVVPIPVLSTSSAWYLAISSQGATAAQHVPGSSKPAVTVVQLTPNSVSTPAFTDGVFAGNQLTMSGNFSMTEVSGGPASPPGAPTYTPGALDCQNTGDYWAGDVWAGGTGSGDTSGSCMIGNPRSSPPLIANLYISPDSSDPSGTVTFANSATVTGTVYATGSVNLTHGTMALGGIVTNGSVTINSSATPTIGNIYAVGNVNITLSGGSIANVYSLGTATVSGMNPSNVHSHTAWPTPPSPCASSQVTCISGGGLQVPFPTQSFPPLTYLASQWSGYALWVDPNDPLTTPYPSGCTSNVNGKTYQYDMANGKSNYRYAAGSATAEVYYEIATATSPTVIETPCALQLDDKATNGQITVSTNLAVFAQGGFFFDNWNSGALVGAVGSTTYDLYFVVPYSGSGPYPPNGEPAPSSCPPSSVVPNSYLYGGEGQYASGDIWLQNGLPSNVHGFYYTPDNMCTASNPTVTGQAYVGGSFPTGTGWAMTADVNMTAALTSSSSSSSGQSLSVLRMQ